MIIRVIIRDDSSSDFEIDSDDGSSDFDGSLFRDNKMTSLLGQKITKVLKRKRCIH